MRDGFLVSIFRQTVRGMRDLLSDEAEMLRDIEEKARESAKLFGYREIITPILENYDLLAAKIGEENRKRMYVFEDLGGRKVALRPEFTASVARVVATRMASAPKPIRFFSAGSLYRYDEPQFGRYREFWQVNYELMGSDRPEADAEILSISNNLVWDLGLKDYSFKINSVGIIRSVLDKERIDEEKQNEIMQLLDKKQQKEALALVRRSGGSQKSLSILEELFQLKGEENTVIGELKKVIENYPEATKAADNLSEILRLFKSTNPQCSVTLEAGFARGLEYYTGIIFEIFVSGINIAVGGGGRYDGLLDLFSSGSGSIPAVGVALGIDRLALALQKQGATRQREDNIQVVVIPVDDQSRIEAFKKSSLLRKKGIKTEVEVMGRSVSRALSDADKKDVDYAIIIGPEETEEGLVVLRDMKKRIQEKHSLEEAARIIISHMNLEM